MTASVDMPICIAGIHPSPTDFSPLSFELTFSRFSGLWLLKQSAAHTLNLSCGSAGLIRPKARMPQLNFNLVLQGLTPFVRVYTQAIL